MWLLYFLITTGLAMLAGTPEQWAFTGRRGIVVVAGIFCTFILYQLLQRVQPRSFGARLAAAMGTAIPLVILYATVNLLVFFYWFPSDDTQRRSEEHTSELQSLMRISYAVFCLKKKTKITKEDNKRTHINN